MWQFMALLAVHFVADFICQTHWQASNKSKSNWALFRHVASYTGVLAFACLLIFPLGADVGLFVVVNGALHFGTDWLTSRWSSRLIGSALRDTCTAQNFAKTYGKPPSEDDMRLMEIDPGRHWHNFFVVIGLDQLVHQLTLGGTMLLIIGRL